VYAVAIIHPAIKIHATIAPINSPLGSEYVIGLFLE